MGGHKIESHHKTLVTIVLVGLVIHLTPISDSIAAGNGGDVFWGIIGGFLSLAGAALLNADLQRRRDDRLRDEETKGLAQALASEVRSFTEISRVWHNRLNDIPRPAEGPPDNLKLPVPSVYNGNVDNVGLLSVWNDALLDKLAKFHFIRERIETHIDYVKLISKDSLNLDAQDKKRLADHFEGYVDVGRELYPLLKAVAEGKRDPSDADKEKYAKEMDDLLEHHPPENDKLTQ